MDDRLTVRFRVVQSWDPAEIVALYRAAGWWDDQYDPAGIIPLIRGSYRFVVGTGAEGTAIAMGRLLSDGLFTGIIHDLCVLPAFRGQDIGTGLISVLVAEAAAAGLTRVYLVAEPGTDRFYEKSGFIREQDLIFLIQAGHNEDNQDP